MSVNVNRYREETAVNDAFRSLNDKILCLSIAVKDALYEVYELGYRDACVDEVKYITEKAIREIIREIQKPNDENNKEETEA